VSVVGHRPIDHAGSLKKAHKQHIHTNVT